MLDRGIILFKWTVHTTLRCLQVALRESISRGMNFDRYSCGAFFLQTSLIATCKKYTMERF